MDLSEGRLIRNQSSTRNLTEEDVRKLIYANFLVLEIFRQDPDMYELAANYASKSIVGNGFRNFRPGGTDLYGLIHSAVTPDFNKIKKNIQGYQLLNQIEIDTTGIIRHLKRIAKKQPSSSIDELFLRELLSDLDIMDNHYNSMRILIDGWSSIDRSKQEVAISRLLMVFRAHGVKSDLHKPLKRYAKSRKLDISDKMEDPEQEQRGSHAAAAGLGALAGIYLSRRKK